MLICSRHPLLSWIDTSHRFCPHLRVSVQGKCGLEDPSAVTVPLSIDCCSRNLLCARVAKMVCPPDAEDLSDLANVTIFRLVANSRPAEARDTMASLHGNGVLTAKITEEFAQMEADVLKRDASATGWAVLYSTLARRRRLSILLCMSFFGQFSGNNVGCLHLM